MRGAEGIVFAFGALGETGKAAALAQRADAVAAAGEDLVRIGLMADIEDQLVVRRVEDVMQRHREFDDAEAGAEMAAGHRDGVDHLLAQFVGKLAQIAAIKRAQLFGHGHAIQQRRLRRQFHSLLPHAAAAPAMRSKYPAAARKRSAFSSNKSR